MGYLERMPELKGFVGERENLAGKDEKVSEERIRWF
jgi:hypothetical protein